MITLFRTLVIGMAGSLPVFSAAQSLLRYLPIDHPGVVVEGTSSDGGMFISYEGTSPALAKLDGSGALLWAKEPGAHFTGFIPDDSGGGIAVYGSDGLFVPDDSLSNRIVLRWLDADGVVTATHREDLKLNDIIIANTPLVLRDHVWNASGELFLLFWTYLDNVLVKLDAQSEVVWVRMVADESIQRTSMRALADGGVLLATEDAMRPVNVWRISADGVVLWSKRIGLTAPMYISGSAVVLEEDGSVAVAFSSRTLVNPRDWLIVGKLDGAADLQWLEAYWRPVLDMSVLPGDGERRFAAKLLPNGNYLFGSDISFEIGPQGQFVRERICTTPTEAVLAENISHILPMEPQGDGWSFSGTRRWTDPNFGLVVQQPMFGLLPLELDSSCFWQCTERTDIQSELAPPELLDVRNTIGWNAYTHVALSWPNTVLADASLATLEDACTLPEVVELTNVQDVLAPGTLLPHPNPLAAGQPLYVETRGAVTVEVLDAQGRVVDTRRALDRSVVLETHAWPAGLYLVRATDQRGRLVGTGRVVVY